MFRHIATVVALYAVSIIVGLFLLYRVTKDQKEADRARALLEEEQEARREKWQAGEEQRRRADTRHIIREEIGRLEDEKREREARQTEIAEEIGKIARGEWRPASRD